MEHAQIKSSSKKSFKAKQSDDNIIINTVPCFHKVIFVWESLQHVDEQQTGLADTFIADAS